MRLAFFGRAPRSGRMHLIRRLRGCAGFQLGRQGSASMTPLANHACLKQNLFHSRMIRPVVGGGGTCLKHLRYLSTKGHEGPRRGWRRLKRVSPKVRKGQKRYPRRGTKDHEGVGEDSRGFRQRSGRGNRFPRRGWSICQAGNRLIREGTPRGWKRLERGP